MFAHRLRTLAINSGVLQLTYGKPGTPASSCGGLARVLEFADYDEGHLAESYIAASLPTLPIEGNPFDYGLFSGLALKASRVDLQEAQPQL